MNRLFQCLNNPELVPISRIFINLEGKYRLPARFLIIESSFEIHFHYCNLSEEHLFFP